MRLLFSILMLLNLTICCAQQNVQRRLKLLNIPNTTNETIENKCKNHFLGNSTYFGLARNGTKNKEYSISIGRSFRKKNEAASKEDGPVGNFSFFSWGAGLGLVKKQFETDKTFHAFYEYNFIPLIPVGNFGLRGEYIYNFSNKQQYFRPSFGMALFYIDLDYNYSFLLNGTKSENIYRHGFSIRIKYFTNRKKMEVHTF